MKRVAPLIVFLVFAPSASAQQQPTLAELRGALSSAIAQADAIRNLHIAAEVEAAGMAEQIATLRAWIQELEKNQNPTASAPQ